MEGERVGVSLQLSVVLQPTVRVELRINAGSSDDGKPPLPPWSFSRRGTSRMLLQQSCLPPL